MNQERKITREREIDIIDLLIENNMPRWIAIVIGVSLIKIFDVVVTVVIARIIYLIIPIDYAESWISFSIIYLIARGFACPTIWLHTA